MDIKAHILAKIQKQKQLKASEIIKETGFSRTYVNRALQTLRDDGSIVLLGKANRAVYVLAEKHAFDQAKKDILQFSTEIINDGRNEDLVLDEIKSKTGIFSLLSPSVANLVSHSFLEILNNAIEHSRSEKILIKMKLLPNEKIVSFNVVDHGVGIFNNIKNNWHLPDNISAIQHLLKGKQTTAPQAHSGQGIFFSSKMADAFSIESSNKRVRFLNVINEVFIEDCADVIGTEVNFVISTESKKTVRQIFDNFTNADTFEFSKTKISIKLYKINKNLLSRSEARRIAAGLEEFKEIILDFKDVETIGQGFADEIWRVWQNRFPDKKIEYINANENVEAMVKMAMSSI